MKLRTAAFVGGVSLVAVVVVAVAVSVSVVVDRAARRQVAADLDEAASALQHVLAYQRTQLENDAEIISDEPRIKALFGADLDVATIAGEAVRAKERIGSDILLMCDDDGYLLVDVDHPDDSGTLLTDNPVVGPVVKDALSKGRGSGVWTTDKDVLRVQAQSIRFGDEVRGCILIGQRVTDDEARTIASQVGSEVVVELGDRVVASSTGESPDSDRFVSRRAPFSGYVGDRPLGIVLLEDLEAALEPGRRMMRVLYVVFAGAVLAAIALALLASRRLARPLDSLVSFTRRIAAGDLDERCDAGGLYEVRTLGESMNHMATELRASRKLLAEKERLERELQIASRIQTSIVPKRLSLTGYRIAGHMATADEVGGDYYDIHETAEGGWIAIGDVSGHGLDAGLIMMMVQTAVSSLVHTAPEASPSRILKSLNQVIFANIHDRLQVSRHMTLSLLRVAGGDVRFAGAHMDILVLRAASGECESIQTPGTWIGITDDVADHMVDAQLTLQAGDMMVLYTDGVTEATDAGGQLFGLDRLRALVREHAARDPDALVAEVVRAIDAFQLEQFDDFSILVARRER